jgi:hypothetical protein
LALVCTPNRDGFYPFVRHNCARTSGFGWVGTFGNNCAVGYTCFARWPQAYHPVIIAKLLAQALLSYARILAEQIVGRQKVYLPIIDTDYAPACALAFEYQQINACAAQRITPAAVRPRVCNQARERRACAYDEPAGAGDIHPCKSASAKDEWVRGRERASLRREAIR